MIIKNNKSEGLYFRYKLNGVIKKFYIAGYTEVDIPDLTDINQIVSNTYQRRLRHIEERFDKNFITTFEVPGDADFTVYVIVSTTTLSGTIYPLGSVSVSEGENQIYTMTPSSISFYLSAQTLGNSGGTISPSGMTVTSNAYYYLSGLTVDTDTTKVSAVTGSVSAATTYTFTDVLTAHTIHSIFALTTGSTVFTMTPTSNYYLNSLTINSGNNQASAVTGSVSGACTYELTNTSSGKTIAALFKAYGQ
jgi:hypothetical protein